MSSPPSAPRHVNHVGSCLLVALVVVTTSASCASQSSSGEPGGGDAGAGEAMVGDDAGSAGDGSVGIGGDGGSPGVDASPGDGAAPPPQPVCPPPIQAVDASAPTSVVGTGSVASCTEQALAAAVAKGGVVTFDCGGPAAIQISQEIAVPADRDITIDGGGGVTLDGGGKTRLLHLDNHNYRTNKHVFALQHLTLANAKATGTPIPPAPAPCSQGYQTDGGGGAVLVNDGVLHVVDVTFLNDAAASPGPDVAGGAVYATGSLDVTIVSSRFSGNSASNGGAVGSLNSDLTLVDDTFQGNHATGSGANSVDTSKCSVNGGEIGNGGNGGAVSIDGGSDGKVTVCGCVFSKNDNGALGGALFRTPDGAQQETNIDRTTFDGNTAATGGGAIYLHNSKLVITASTLSNNSAPGAGAIQADGTTVDFTNDTFAGNAATKGLGGAMSLFGNDGTIQSCTFANNVADGGSGLFGAAIAGGTALTIDDTIFDGNTSMDCGAPMTCQDGSSTGQADLQWPAQHVVCTGADPACASGTTFADPKLSALGMIGGPTQTMLPQPGSPAIGAGKACPPTDQRGNPRPSDGCTVGAVEAP